MKPDFPLVKIVILILLLFIEKKVSALGSFSSIAASYGEKGTAFCGLKPDGSHLPDCYGSNDGLIRETPNNLPFLGLTGGNGFICGLLTGSNQPFCWGDSNFIPMRVPLTRAKDVGYTQISAGDSHLCGLRKPTSKKSNLSSLVDCWGYNMTQSYDLGAEILSITAGSGFNCALFAKNMNVLCWGDVPDLFSSIPPWLKFKKISAGGFHICVILNVFRSLVFCIGKSLEPQTTLNATDNAVYSVQQTFVRLPKDAMDSVVGGMYSSCGIRSLDGNVVCWGYSEENSTPPPSGVKFTALAAGDYFTCGIISSGKSICWGVGFPTALDFPVSPPHRKSYPCPPSFYDADNSNENSTVSNICLPCSGSCPDEMGQVSECNSTSDMLCGYNCSRCISHECFSTCFFNENINKAHQRFWSAQFPILIIQICFALLLFVVVLCVTVYYLRYKIKGLESSHSDEGTMENQSPSPRLPELVIQKAKEFTYEQLEEATDGFNEDSLVGKGSFSCVYKGVLKDCGTPIAVKRAIVSIDSRTCSHDFLTELDLLSRLNHAHLLSLLGYSDQGHLLVYEFMSNGSLHQHLHGKNKELKQQLDWVKRVTIAVQASRGIEYLHGYACPPVIHRDIKSSNILIDEDHNARVSDFGLSVLGPINGGGPLSELPAGTLGYIDPEYYSFHTLTTKSDVYSFGVLLLEILSGRKAVDMQYEPGNIVEWGFPLIESDNIEEILDPVLKYPSDLEALKRVAEVAGRCVRMRGKERPSMDRVTTELEQALAILIGGTWDDSDHILSSEVVLGAPRLFRKASRTCNEEGQSWSEVVLGAPRLFRKASRTCNEEGQSWTTSSSVGSSMRRVSLSSSRESDVNQKNAERSDGSGRVVEEIEPGSPHEQVFLHHNF